MLHAAVLSRRQLLSFSINDRFLHHSFGCAADFLQQLMEIPIASQTSIILRKLEKEAGDVATSH